MPFKRFIKHNKRKPAGQAMVEFALILTVMMGLFVGTFEIMVLFRKRTDLATATRLAARQASELWLVAATDDAFVDDIQLYVWEEMEKMGYDIDWMNNGTPAIDGDDKVRVEIQAAKLNATGDQIIDDGTSKRCTYGQYIDVTLEMDWTFAVLPLDALISNGGASNGVITETALVRCWRGS